MTERGRNVPISKILKVFIFHTILMLFLRSVHLNGLVMGHMKIAIHAIVMSSYIEVDLQCKMIL